MSVTAAVRGDTGRASDRTVDERFAVVLYFDEATEDRVREIWAALDVHGIASAARTYGAGYRPHLTLAIIEPERLTAATRALQAPLAAVAGLPLTLGSLGFFLTEASPAYLSVTATTPLLALHEQVHEALDGTDGCDYYLPGVWVPHCTLAMGVEAVSVVAQVVTDADLPIHAVVSSAHLVRVPRDGGVGATAARLSESEHFEIADPLSMARHRAGPRHRRTRRLPTGFARR